MKIAILGTRGIPANYGGFETFAEQCAVRLALRGHEVTVYGRSHYVPGSLRTYRDVRLVVLPTLRWKYTDTVVHTFLSVLHALPQRYDVLLICNAANSLFALIPRIFRVPVAVNVDGIERRRKKWNWLGRAYYAISERLSLWFADAIVTDAQVIERYTHITGRAPEVPLWGLGLWISKVYYRTPDEASAVAGKLRARRIPCDVLALDGRATWDVQTRFDFRWDPQRFRDPAAALAKMKANAVRICVGEYPYVSVHSHLFRELAGKRYLLKAASGEPYVLRWDTAAATSPFNDVLTTLPDSGIVDFTNPAAFAW